jgi:HD superfamily phosphohydrolase
MLRVVNDELVVDKKGIYSIEKFLIARRLMYWQVYLHKTVLVAENMLVKTLKRAKYLSAAGENLFASPALSAFLKSYPTHQDIKKNPGNFLEIFSQLDDNDIFSALKVWQNHSDPVLAMLSDGLLNRRLFRIEIRKNPFNPELVNNLRKKLAADKGWDLAFTEYIIFEDEVSNSAYNEAHEQVRLWDNTGNLVELSEASDIINPSTFSQADNKYFLCYPKWLRPDVQ